MLFKYTVIKRNHKSFVFYGLGLSCMINFRFWHEAVHQDVMQGQL